MRRLRGFTLVEVVVAGAILLVGAVSLLQAVAWSRMHQSVASHRAQASLYCSQDVDEALHTGYAGLPVGTTARAVALDPAGTPGQVATEVVAETAWADVNGLKRVTVRTTWNEPLLAGQPQLEVSLTSYLGDPVP